MTRIPDALRLFAEEFAPALAEPPAPSRRVMTPRYTIEFSPAPSQSVTSCVRSSPADLDATIAEIRQVVRANGYTGNVWQLGPTSTPAGLPGLLRERGFVPVNRPPYEATAMAMALTSAPPAKTAPGVEARLCQNLDEFKDAIRVAMEAFNEPEEAAAEWLGAAPSFWASQDGEWRFTHVAYVDGKPAGMGFSASGPQGVALNGSGVLPSARGRGVYRAMIAARWERAMELGRLGLAVHAGAMSRPILERCGFQPVCEIVILDDPDFAKA